MTSDPTEEVENEDTWDLREPVAQGPSKQPRAVVSVAFRRDDFKVVADAAEQEGERVSEFIRTAAIHRAKGAKLTDITFAGGTGPMVITSTFMMGSMHSAGVQPNHQSINLEDVATA